MKRVLIVLCACALFASVLYGCAGETAKPEETTAAVPEETPEVTTEEEDDFIPDEGFTLIEPTTDFPEVEEGIIPEDDVVPEEFQEPDEGDVDPIEEVTEPTEDEEGPEETSAEQS